MEDKLRSEIAKRKKEKCKQRNKEIHEHQDIQDDRKIKKRRIDEEGRFKTVVQTVKHGKEKLKEREEVKVETGEKDHKRHKKNPQVRFLGGIIKDMVIEKEIDWQARRKEILENMKREEEERTAKIEKSKS